MMKKLLCLLLCLLLPVSALAAPVRDVRENALGDDLPALRTWLDAVVREALPLEYDENTYVGARVYSCVEEGGCYVLECDVYLEEGGDTLPEYAPDDAVIWLCDATVALRRGEENWEVVSCEVGDYYQSQRMLPTQGDGYSVSLPDLRRRSGAVRTGQCSKHRIHQHGTAERSHRWRRRSSPYGGRSSP